jgi:hypothetical protein
VTDAGRWRNRPGAPYRPSSDGRNAVAAGQADLRYRPGAPYRPSSDGRNAVAAGQADLRYRPGAPYRPSSDGRDANPPRIWDRPGRRRAGRRCVVWTI